MAQDLLLVECVQTHVKVADVAQAWENDFFLEVDYSPGIRVEMINSPVKLSETPAVVREWPRSWDSTRKRVFKILVMAVG